MSGSGYTSDWGEMGVRFSQKLQQQRSQKLDILLFSTFFHFVEVKTIELFESLFVIFKIINLGMWILRQCQNIRS